MRFKALPLLVLLAAPAFALAQMPSPQIGEPALAQPLPLPYDVNANAQADIDAALARAKVSGKRVIVDLGGNWCGDCRVFAAILAVPEVKKFVAAHYEVVMVNVGRYDTNLDVPARFGLATPKAAPTTLIVSADGKLLNADDLVALKDARSMTPQAVVDWLAHWAGPIAKV